MALPEKTLQAAVNREVRDPKGSPAMFGRRLERNFQSLDSRATTLEGRLTNWQDWTPTWANLTVGDGSLDLANYSRVGDSIHFLLIFTFGSTSAITGAPTFTLPVTASQAFIAFGRFYDDSATTYYEGRCDFASTTTAGFAAATTSGTYLTRTAVSSTVPFTWATDDQIIAQGYYQSA